MQAALEQMCPGQSPGQNMLTIAGKLFPDNGEVADDGSDGRTGKRADVLRRRKVLQRGLVQLHRRVQLQLP